MSKIDLTGKTTELKELIKGFETTSFVCYYYYLFNCHVRTHDKPLELNSPLRQLMYLLSVFMDTDPRAVRKLQPMRWDREPIEQLLNEIENGYRYDYINVLSKMEGGHTDFKKYVGVANQTFVNYFTNGRLSYIEQDIEKVEMIFKDHEAFILEQTGLNVSDFLFFFDLVERLDREHFILFRKLTGNDAFLIEGEINYENDWFFDESRLDKISESVERYMQVIPIEKEELYSYMPAEKIDKLLNIFTCSRIENETIRYFNSECLLLKKPIIRLADNTLIVPCAKQLIISIHDFLFEISRKNTSRNQKILHSRDMFLEKKTYKLFRDFFGENKARFYDNYYVNGKEQDLLILHRENAFIIECKASKLNAPYRDLVAAFDRIGNEFKVSIQKGYDQTERIKRIFTDHKELIIYDREQRVIEYINTNRYKNVFSIIVTGERFGPIQTDLGLLLKLSEWDDYPWSVYIDDLEIFLLTLMRKTTCHGELVSYLSAREKLHERLFCADEVELFGYFLMQKQQFLKYCNRLNEYFISSPDMHGLFDDLYQTGLGFTNERNRNTKRIANDNLKMKLLRRKLGLRDINK